MRRQAGRRPVSSARQSNADSGDAFKWVMPVSTSSTFSVCRAYDSVEAYALLMPVLDKDP